MINKGLNLYYKIFNFLSKNRKKNKDLPPQKIHYLIVAVICTSPLMFTYALIAKYGFTTRIPWYVGILSSIIHLLSPLLLRFTNNIFFIASLMVGVGVAHQGTYSFYSGGYYSEILIWYGIIPMLAGIIAGFKAAFTWFSICMTIILTFLFMELNGFVFPNEISSTGIMIGHGLLVFGLILTSTLCIALFDHLTNLHQTEISDKTKKIDNLLRILLHDMSNSIHVMKGTISLLSSKNEKIIQKREYNLSVLKKHNTFLQDTIGSIKSMYVLDNNLKDIELKNVSVQKSLNLILNLLENRTKEKDLTINIFPNEISDIQVEVIPQIFEHQVLQNILTNAIKFSHKGNKIDIFINKIEPQGEIYPAKVILTIKDYGIGMPKEILQNIFNENARTSRPGTQKEAGTGLGMHIIKNFIEKMNGDIKIESEENSGTQIHLYLKQAHPSILL